MSHEHHSGYTPNNLQENLIDLGIATTLLIGSVFYACSDYLLHPNPLTPTPSYISEDLPGTLTSFNPFRP